ncbi:MAG: hypothetical protein U9N78_05565, partial [Actinomycetota bacterium]|nr:hypothetical protein [Actinomycetota bacterium]
NRGRQREETLVLHLGLDLSRKRLDTCLMDDDGVVVETGQEGIIGDALGRFADRQPLQGYRRA